MVKLQPFSGSKCRSLFSLCTVETSLLKTFYSFGLTLSINYKRGNGMGQGEGDLVFCLFILQAVKLNPLQPPNPRFSVTLVTPAGKGG